MKSTFNFTVQYYFPSRAIWAIVAAFFFAGAVATQYYFWGSLALLVCALVLTTKYGFEVNLAANQYQEYTWVLGYKSGEQIKFERIEYLFIKKIKLSRKMNSLLHSTTLDDEEYRAYLKFSEQEKIHFMTKADHNILVTETKKIAQSLSVGLFDYSSGDREQLV